MLAGAVFAVFSWGVIEVLISGLVTDRLNGETTIATEYATAGLEAVRVIKDEDFDALVPVSGTGLDRTGDFFVFAGTNDTFDSKYVRVITIEPGKRDGNGNLTEGDGDVDADTMKVTATVTWSASSSRENSVTLSTYMTRWKTIAPIVAGPPIEPTPP